MAEITIKKKSKRDRLKEFGKKWAPVVFGGVALAVISYDLGKKDGANNWRMGSIDDTYQDDGRLVLVSRDGHTSNFSKREEETTEETED